MLVHSSTLALVDCVLPALLCHPPLRTSLRFMQFVPK